MTTLARSLLLVLTATAVSAFTPLARPARHHPRTKVTVPATLDGFLQSLSVVGTARAIVMRPGPEAILEATVDLGSASVKSSEMPSGKTLVTVANAVRVVARARGQSAT